MYSLLTIFNHLHMQNLSTKNLTIKGAILIVILFIVLKSSSSKETVTNTNSANMETINTDQSQDTSVKPKTTTTKVYSGSVTIDISATSFSPKTITVKQGTVVTWVNRDANIHKILADNGGPTSGDLLKGQKYSFRYNIKGIYGYRYHSCVRNIRHKTETSTSFTYFSI